MGKGAFTVCRAKVLETDDQDVALHGLLKFGSQKLEVEILSGKHKGRKCRANNELRAQMELDKEFKTGDIITVNIPVGDFPDETVLNARDHQSDTAYIDIQNEIAALQADSGKSNLCFDFEHWNS